MQQLNGEQSRFIGFAQLLELFAVLVILIALRSQSYEAMNEIRSDSDRNPDQTQPNLFQQTFDLFSYRRSITTRSQLSFAAIFIARCLNARIRLSFSSMSSEPNSEIDMPRHALRVLLGFSVAVFNLVFCSIRLALMRN